MRLEFEPALLEQSVFLALRANAANLFSEYRRRSDELYNEKILDTREAGFASLSREFFQRTGLEAAICGIVNCYTGLMSRLDALILLHCDRSRDEDAELFCNSQNRFTALLRIRPETMIYKPSLERIALHEIGHIDDMLNPAFEYTPKFCIPDVNAEQAGMIRDRYRALWDLFIDARLVARQLPSGHDRKWHELNFMRLFGVSMLTKRIFENLWRNRFALATTNAVLIQAAQHPVELARLAGLEIDGKDAASEVRGFAAVCPFCGCPTMRWASADSLSSPRVLQRLRKNHPLWKAKDGLCAQCIEYLQLPELRVAVAGE